MTTVDQDGAYLDLEISRREESAKYRKEDGGGMIGNYHRALLG